jgi:hypothetical protein
MHWPMLSFVELQTCALKLKTCTETIETSSWGSDYRVSMKRRCTKEGRNWDLSARPS